MLMMLCVAWRCVRTVDQHLVINSHDAQVTHHAWLYTTHLTSNISRVCNDMQDSIETCVVTQHSCDGCDRLTCVYVFQSTQHLIQEELMVFRCQVIICLDDLQVQTQQFRALHNLLVHVQMQM